MKNPAKHMMVILASTIMWFAITNVTFSQSSHSSVIHPPQLCRLAELFSFPPHCQLVRNLSALPTRVQERKDSYLAGKYHQSARAVKKSFQLDLAKDLPDLRLKNDAPEHYLSLATQILSILPRKDVLLLKTLIIKYDDTSERGLGGKSTIIINAKKDGAGMSDHEFLSVLIHEMGHVTDLGGLQGSPDTAPSNFRDHSETIWGDDPSLQFYQMSWHNESTKKNFMIKSHFLSVYGMSDPFEDFAESYNYYVTHGREFRYYAYGSEIIKQKYEFLKNHVFNGYEFHTGILRNIKSHQYRYWDSTLLNFNLDELLSAEPNYLVLEN